MIGDRCPKILKLLIVLFYTGIIRKQAQSQETEDKLITCSVIFKTKHLFYHISDDSCLNHYRKDDLYFVELFSCILVHTCTSIVS